MANYLFLRGSRNKKFFINVAKELNKLGHHSFLLQFELGELLFKSKEVQSDFAPFKVSHKEYPISNEALLNMPIYNITYAHRFLKKEISSAELKVYKKYMYIIDDYIDKNKIDVICLFNGYHWIDQVAKFIANKRSLKVFYFEDGLFRPFTLTCDPAGINTLSSFSRDPSFYDTVKVDNERMKKYLYYPEYPLFLKKKKESLIAVGFVKLISMIGSLLRLHPNYYVHITFQQALKYFLFKIIYSHQKNDQIELPDEYLFVPFQVSRDTQILYNSPRISNMNEFLDIVYQAVITYNKKHGRNLKLVVKEHPEDISRNNYKNLKKIYKNCKEVIFVKKCNVKQLINNCIAVITINSTVGIEALAQNKRVITLGETFYNIEGIVHRCIDPSHLFETLEKTLTSPINTERINKFIYYLRFFYQVEGTICISNEQTAKNVAKRINIVK